MDITEIHVSLEEALEEFSPKDLKSLLIKGILDLDEDEEVDLEVIKNIISEHVYPRLN